MNIHETDERLKAEVERIVQPIWAMAWRKNRMREELLGHLQQLVDREGGLDEALKHFGDPQPLCTQLQASVPAIERFVLAVLQRFIVRRSDERSVHMVLRVFLLWLCFQKLVDGMCIFSPRFAEWVMAHIAGAGVYPLTDTAQVLMVRLWGCTSLLWAYVLLRASFNPRKHSVILEASIIGFLTGAIVALSVPNNGVRLCGLLFMAEGLLLLWGRMTLGKDRASLGVASDAGAQKDSTASGCFEARSAVSG